MPNLHHALAAVLLASASLLLRDPAARRRALAGTVPLVLALAARARAIEMRGTLDDAFVLVNGALLAGGLGLVAIALARGWRTGDRFRVAPLAVIGLILALPAISTGLVPLRALLLGLGGATVAHGALALIPAASWAPAVLPPGRPWWVGVLLALTAVLSPHMVPLALGLVLLLAWLRWWTRAALAALLLVPVLVLASAIAGPIGLGMATLGEVPFSPYAAVIVGGALILAAFVVAGVLPFAWDRTSALVAPVAAFLLLRVVLPALPDAVTHWRSVAAGWLAAASVVAAVRGRPDAFLAASGLFVLLTGPGLVAGASGVLLAVLGSGEVLRQSGASAPWARATGVVAAAVALALGLGAALEREVVYTVLMAATAMGLVARSPQWLANTAVRARASNETTS